MALSRHHAAFTRPRSVQEIVSEAESFAFSTERPLQQWLRAAKMLLTEASVCEADRDLQMAYLYLFRHADLVLSKLPQHPDYHNKTFKTDVAQARKAVQRNLLKLEQWKPRINQEHQRYLKAMERRDAQLSTNFTERRSSQGSIPSISGRRSSLDDSRQSLNVNHDSRLAVLLAQQEMQRRDVNKIGTIRAGIDSEVVHARRQGLVLSDYDDQMNDLVTINREISRMDQDTDRQTSLDRGTRDVSVRNYAYPSVVPANRVEADLRLDDDRAFAPPYPATVNAPPRLPSKLPLIDNTTQPPPARPPKLGSSIEPKQVLPSKYTFATTAKTESGSPLRPLLLPSGLADTFVKLAALNTTKNLETCGVLACTPHAGALFITHLILPAQTSTSDTCDTTVAGDDALFNYCDEHDILVCGWIHTHPTQSCFLSSRDLHTSSGYQVMLPEAIAIVCAPSRQPRDGIFRLTDPPGLPHVLECTRPGIFHPHDISDLYTDTLGGRGHVIEGPGLEYKVVDMREK